MKRVSLLNSIFLHLFQQSNYKKQPGGFFLNTQTEQNKTQPKQKTIVIIHKWFKYEFYEHKWTKN